MSPDPGRDDFLALQNVSRETFERLEIYQALLKKWNPRINLVGRKTLADVWRRHFLDSAQLVAFLPDSTQNLVDLGSGAGFPGLVLAMLRPDVAVHLVDSDQRKCVFLTEVARQTGVNVQIHAARIEALTGLTADVISARALASVVDLLDLSTGIATKNTRYLFLKGRDIDAELTLAAKCWKMSYQLTPSIVDPKGSVLQIDQATRISDNAL